jgi:hypothetical protein
MIRSAAALLMILMPAIGEAECVNRFFQRREAPARWQVTLLTGRMTFQEAQVLSREIAAGRASAVEWVDERGKPLGKQVGALRAVRPMPVACEGKPSGSVIVITVLAPKPPAAKMFVKFAPNNTVEFDEQK